MKVKVINISASDIVITISSVILLLFPFIVLFGIPENILLSIPEFTRLVIALTSSFSIISAIMLPSIYYIQK